jgi:pimeloyl-ACP methyl ester carboxylesterase
LPTVNVADFKELRFNNLVDHFDFQDGRTFEQRYWVNDVYWTDESAPNFIYICGEYRCSVPSTRMYPFMLGANHGARLFVLEHRFYGDSQPFADWSLDSLRFLSSEQALADLAYFLGEMNLDDPNRQTVVIGGSYPGALSAWFRARYPTIAMASWSSSGVVQPVVDFWHFDEQVYISSVKSGDFCPKMIKESNDWVTEQGRMRDAGCPANAIDKFLAGTISEGMNTGDFMYYYADIFVESVQYGNRTLLCDTLQNLANEGASQQDIFNAMTTFGREVPDVNPPDYDANLIKSPVIDPFSAARPWTYQYCTEYGWFQTPSQIHPMRSQMLQLSYWPEMCERAFPGLNMNGLPRALQTTIDQGGFDIQGTNTFFTNGAEDPWQWATQRQNRPVLDQVAETSNCTDCGHCAELYTPQESDPVELKATREHIRVWLDGLLATYHPETFLQ